MAEENDFNPHPIIPVGTQVVTLDEVKMREPPRRVRECGFGALAPEGAPVDPRL